MRLLRWYPQSWRERYSEEFVDHMEQEFSDRPNDFGRALNIAHKGIIARVGDLGLSKSGVNPVAQTRAALGTSFALAGLEAILALNFWSRAMLLWSGRRYHPIPVSATTGILTVATGLLLVVFVAVTLAVAFSTVRQMVRGRGRPLIGPSLLAVGSGGFLLYAARFFPRMLTAYIQGGHGFQGIRLSHPGQVIDALAEITWDLTQKWIALWGQGPIGTTTTQAVVDNCVPLAVLVFGVALALLIRRVELPRMGARLSVPTVALVSMLTGVFFIAYLAWSAVSGPAGAEYFFPESRWLGITYLVFLALVALLIGRSGLLARPHEPRQQRNQIEILES